MAIVDGLEPSGYYVDQFINRRGANGQWQRHGLVKRHGPLATRECVLREGSRLVYHTADETSRAASAYWA